MAITLPNIPKLKATAARTTPGSKTGAAISGVKSPANPFAPKAKVKAAAKPQVSPYDQFTLAQPFNPNQIPTTAQSSYNGDVANATRLAQMGQPTAASITQDYAGRGAASNSVYQDLASHLAGIQQATVAQGDAGAAGLGAQNAAVAAGAPHIAGAPTAPALPTAGVQAVLGAQTAAAGNYGGTLQAAALSSGAQANQRALDAGTVAATDATNNTQKTLASLLSGLPTESSREASMTDANSKVDAANLQTKLSIYQGNVQQAAALRQLGYTKQADAADRQNKIDLAQINQSAATDRTALQQQGQTTRTGITQTATDRRAAASNAAKVKAAKLKGTTTGTGTASASSRRQALNQAIKIINTTGGTKTTSQSPSSYKATIQAVTSSGKPNPLASPKDVPVDPTKLKTWKPPAGFVVVNPPTATSSKSTTTTVNKPGSYTKYNRAASYLKAQGWTQPEIKQALKQYHP